MEWNIDKATKNDPARNPEFYTGSDALLEFSKKVSSISPRPFAERVKIKIREIKQEVNDTITVLILGR